MESKLEKRNLKIKLGAINSLLSKDASETIKDALKYIDELESQIDLLEASLDVQAGLTGKYANEIESLKSILEEQSIKFVNNESTIRASVTNDDIDNILANTIIKVEKYGDKTTVLKATLPNGFVIVESSSCVDPKNFDMAIGEKSCMEKLENKIWELEGYILQSRISL